MTQSRPRGPAWPITEEWKRLIAARMTELRISRSDLARAIKVSPAAISLLFSRDSKQTRLLLPIHEVLRLPMPSHPADVGVETEIDIIEHNLALLDPEERATFIKMIELAAKRQKSNQAKK